MATEDERKAMEANRGWSIYNFESAGVLAQTDLVRVHGVQVGAKEASILEQTKCQIMGKNKGLHPGLDIVAARPSKAASRPAQDGRRKRRSVLDIEVRSSEEVNDLVEKDLAFKGQTCKCEFA